MKAIVITQPGEPEVLQMQEVPEPEPSAHELLVRVQATALNRADLLQRLGQYPAPTGTRDDIPGLEFAGEIEQIGDKVTTHKPGDRVMGLLPGEGYAEKVVSHERLAIPIPQNLSFEEAAAIPEVFLTAFDALFLQLRLQAGETCLIHTIGGGVGLAALQLAKQAGATVFGTSSSDDKISRAHRMGLDFGINHQAHDFERAILAETDDRGVNAILDTVGAPFWQPNLNCLAVKGRLILVGMLGGAKTEIALSDILTRRIRVIGTVLRPRPQEEKAYLVQRFIERCLPLLACGKIKPVVDRTFALAEAAEAHTYMQANKNFGKIVLTVTN